MLYLQKQKNIIKENIPLTSIITGVKVEKTTRDDRIKLSILVLTDNKQVTVSDVLYDSSKYIKRINAIYTALGLEKPTREEFKKHLSDDFHDWKNKPFLATYKKNTEGYMQPYIYVAPNTQVSEKWNNRGFGEKEGQIHNEYVNDKIIESQLKQRGIDRYYEE